jgi:hypothetical protein
MVSEAAGGKLNFSAFKAHDMAAIVDFKELLGIDSRKGVYVGSTNAGCSQGNSSFRYEIVQLMQYLCSEYNYRTLCLSCKITELLTCCYNGWVQLLYIYQKKIACFIIKLTKTQFIRRHLSQNSVLD